ncbi:endonuclease III [Arcobacter sp. LA11]|uniref:endonuclease III domain-containing protein n=1 Tax=Arcobacter sp. LA11 TaxID=1898176 RepID=UPI0009F930AA|nr:endonuclease III [Arcobacter sp. LA11]
MRKKTIMTTKTFLNILEILQNNIPSNSPSNILKNSFERNPYTILMATLLSLRTKDENTAQVCGNLFNPAISPKELLEIPIEKLEQIVRPTGMYRKKAQVLREVSLNLIERFDSQVPNTKEELLSLKGVGEKTANIVLNNAFDIPTIAVDTHVHRLPNLWKFIDTKSEKETFKALCKKVPKEFWNRLNFTLVSFGQTICLPRNPNCEQCPVQNYCDETKSKND